MYRTGSSSDCGRGIATAGLGVARFKFYLRNSAALIEKKRIESTKSNLLANIEKRGVITSEQLRQLYEYHPNTGHFYRRKKSTGQIDRDKPAGSVSKDGYVTISIAYKPYKAHRLAWLYVHGQWPQGFIDHINGKSGDNRISNLRDTTHQGNMHNRANHASRAASGIVGVHKDDSGGWRAQIIRYGVPINLGTFTTKQEAAAAYHKAKLNLDLPEQKSSV